MRTTVNFPLKVFSLDASLITTKGFISFAIKYSEGGSTTKLQLLGNSTDDIYCQLLLSLALNVFSLAAFLKTLY